MPESSDPEGLKRFILGLSPNILAQTANEDAVSNESLAEMMVAQTASAVSSGNLLARKSEVDLLLRLAGTTQISKALRSVGVPKGKQFVLILAGEERDFRTVERSGVLGEERVGRSELNKSELARVEKAALLNAQRG